MKAVLAEKDWGLMRIASSASGKYRLIKRKFLFSVLLQLEITLIFSNVVSVNNFFINFDELKEKWYNMGLSVIFLPD